MRVHLLLRRIGDRFFQLCSDHSRAVILIGFLLAVTLAVGSRIRFAEDSYGLLKNELLLHEDLHNLYYASARASWKDSLSWWVGSWNYPGVGYYRPLTSVLFLAEYRLFHDNFANYNRVTLGIHTANAALLYLLVVSLYRRRESIRALLGVIAVYFFATGGSSLSFAADRAITWWPAQNDPLSLLFGLLSLLLLDSYLSTPNRGTLVASLISCYLSIASKEMGFVVAPMAMCLVIHHKRRICSPAFHFAILAVALYMFRLLVIPNPWMPSYLHWRVWHKAFTHWTGILLTLIEAQMYWLPATAFAIIALGWIGLRKRWSVYTIIISMVMAFMGFAQFLANGGSFALVFEPLPLQQLAKLLTYLLSLVFFSLYSKQEPGGFAAAAFVLSYIPILGYTGLYYYYWPSAFLGLADAVFCSCLIRWVMEVRRTANWGPPQSIVRAWRSAFQWTRT
jgi:hypothetical protein